MDFDEILPDIGEYGRYQKLMMCFVLLPGILPCGFHAYNQLFMSIVPEHWCAVPELLNLNCSAEVRKKLSIPLNIVARPRETRFSRCLMYGVNYTQLLLDSGRSGISSCAWPISSHLPTTTTTTPTSTNIGTQNSVNINEVSRRVFSKLSPETLLWEVNSSWTKVPCTHGWEYQLGKQVSSVVSDWNLVCERELLVPFSLAVFAIGGLLGNYIFGYFQDCFGRRPSFFIFLLILSTCGTATAFATNFNTWLLIRFLNGLAIPAIMATPYILAVELVGHPQRTLVTVITNVAYSLTLVLLSIVVYLVREWHQLAMATTIPFVAFFLYWWVLPESPRWLLAQGQFEEVEKIVRTIAHVNKMPLPPDYMITLKRRFQLEYALKDREEMSRRKYRVRDLFKTPNMRKKTFILTYLWFVTTSAYVGLTYYAPSLPGDYGFTFFVSAAVELPSYLVLWPCLGNWGRRWTLCLSLTIAGIACFGTVLFANNQTSWLLLLYAIGKFCVTIAFVVLPVMASELYPVAVRGIGLRFSSYISMTGSMVVPFVNQLGHEIVVLPLMMMGFILLVGGFLAAFLPETLYQRVPHTLQDGEEMGKDFSWNDLKQCCPQRHSGIEGSYQGDDDDDFNYSEGRSESPLRRSRNSMLTSSQELHRMPISRTPSTSSSAAHVSYKVENSKCFVRT